MRSCTCQSAERRYASGEQAARSTLNARMVRGTRLTVADDSNGSIANIPSLRQPCDSAELDTPVGRLKIRHSLAAVAELADAQGSGPCSRKRVQVQLLSAACAQRRRRPISGSPSCLHVLQ